MSVVRDVTKILSQMYSNFNTIYISGDHGPHFSSIYTIFNESRMMRRYSKRFHVLSLCSYHCYNSCDAAGAETKTLARQLTKAGSTVLTSQEYSLAVRESTYANSWAYSFDQINRNVGFWTPDDGKEIANPFGLVLRDMCEIAYASPNGAFVCA